MAHGAPFRKQLVANRGEVAVRVMRACAGLGIGCVGVYTEPDRHGLHVKRADEAHSLGPDPLGGYLNAGGLVDLAMSTGCEAIHPGHGFLSEDRALAEFCVRRGLRFVDPSAEVMRRMGGQDPSPSGHDPGGGDGDTG